eukprot:scaffold7614_cov417-Prasinococcus_capsulatus_cf.AAC.1
MVSLRAARARPGTACPFARRSRLASALLHYTKDLRQASRVLDSFGGLKPLPFYVPIDLLFEVLHLIRSGICFVLSALRFLLFDESNASALFMAGWSFVVPGFGLCVGVCTLCFPVGVEAALPAVAPGGRGGALAPLFSATLDSVWGVFVRGGRPADVGAAPGVSSDNGTGETFCAPRLASGGAYGVLAGCCILLSYCPTGPHAIAALLLSSC